MRVLVSVLVALLGAVTGAAIGVALTYWLLSGQGVNALIWAVTGVFFCFPATFAGATAAGVAWQRFFPDAFRDARAETVDRGRYGIGASLAYGVAGSATLVVLVVVGWLTFEYFAWGNTSATSTSFVSTPSLRGKLCTKPGVRYAGAAPQGVEVCFTLTTDRGTWIEIAWRFRTAGVCLGAPPGTVYGWGDSIGGNGRITAPGFKATIHGARAAGVVTDRDNCPGKKFTWSARRIP